ncbi:MAG: transposase family protein [Moorea sp. SIOASIH]|uniref:transposase family protein n=1 Tax=Moorena sp. SIOASIH TaxID=2607817 RepID=UPI0013B77EE2|nr:transposase family protein [Moorena sp. SIOASIH]NEO41986.1 transposase family protein [Moorena sp. SIOASIH]
MAIDVDPTASLMEHFGDLDDPRIEHLVEHRLLDILAVTICAVICLAESWVDIENYGLAKQQLLEGVSWVTQRHCLP